MKPNLSVRSASTTRDAILHNVSESLRPLRPLWRMGLWIAAFVTVMVANLCVRLATQSYLAEIRTYEHRADVSNTELGQLALELEVRRGAAHLQLAAAAYGLTAPVAVETVFVALPNQDVTTP